jgi:hypothetical protein
MFYFYFILRIKFFKQNYATSLNRVIHISIFPFFLKKNIFFHFLLLIEHIYPRKKRVIDGQKTINHSIFRTPQYKEDFYPFIGKIRKQGTLSKIKFNCIARFQIIIFRLGRLFKHFRRLGY